MTRQQALPHHARHIIGPFLKKLSTVKVVSFDVFDTLLLRKVLKPVDVFTLLESRLLQYGIDIDFTALRVKAEQEARKLHYNQQDVTLDQIYKVLKAYYPAQAAVTLKELKALELKFEQLVNTQHPIGSLMLQEATKARKDIHMISDMYLPSKVVKKLLEQAGYPVKLLRNLTVSSDTLQTKTTGDAYKRLKANTGAKNNEILHVGDNLYSDILVAKRLGLKAVHIKRAPEFIRDLSVHYRAFYKGVHIDPTPHVVSLKSIIFGLFAKRFLLHFMRGVFSSTNPKHLDKYEYFNDLGYLVTGPFVTGFTLWVMANATKDKLDALYFLGRDGYLPYLAYKQLSKSIASNHKIPRAYYIQVSRRLLSLPGYALFDPDRVIYYITGNKPGFAVKDYIERLDIRIPSRMLKPALKKTGLTLNSVINSERDFAQLKAFFIELMPYIIQQLKEEARLVHTFLEDNDIFKHKKVGFVDLGWSGNMQLVIQKFITQHDPSIKTKYYFVALTPTRASNTLKLHNLSRVFIDIYPKMYGNILKSVEIIENLTPAPEDTAIKLVQTRNGLSTKLADSEPPELKQIKHHVIQGATQFLEDLSSLLQKMELSIPLKVVRKHLDNPWHRFWFLLPYLRIAQSPTLVDAYLLGSIPHSRGIGASKEWRPIALPPQRVTLKTILYPSQLKSKINHIYSEFKLNYWKVGYLKNLNKIERSIVLWIYTHERTRAYLKKQIRRFAKAALTAREFFLRKRPVR